MHTSSAAPLHARLTPLAASIAIACTNAFATTYTVTNTNDSGASSLRQAITSANTNCSTDPAPVIDFAITGTGPFTITPSSPLPVFSCISSYTPSVDAGTQPGQIAISGSSATGSIDANGLEAQGAAILTVKGIDVHAFSYGGASAGIKGRVKVYGSTVTGNDTGIHALTGSEIGDVSDPSKGNRIAGNGEGIYVYGSGVTIARNYIGTLDGTTAAGNAIGITVNGAPTTISANVVSGNTSNGIELEVGNVTVRDNLIGTNASGSSALGNQGYGIYVRSGASDTITGNTISGNQNGMIVWSSDTSTTISGNKIGTNKDGTAAIPNLDVGLNFDCGGWPSGGSVTSNIISGNGGNGLEIFGVDWLTVSGNKIGVAANGTTAIGNVGHGVVLGDGECWNPWNNVLSNNTIANNGLAGIEFSSGKMNTATQNRIYANSRINIDIEDNYAYGALPNDGGDIDIGANNRQNYPDNIVVTQAPGGTSTTIDFTLDTTAGTFTVEAFENPDTGIGAGHTYLDSTTVTSAGAGPVAGSLTLSGAHDFISLTATSPASPTGDTSEFSSPITTVTPTPGVSLSATALDFRGVPMGSTSSPQTVTLTSVGSAPYVINSFDTSALCYGGSTLPCSGGFSCSSNCVTGSETTSCSISATFTPNYVGEDSSDIYICDNTSASPQLISLYGTGVLPPPLTLSPASFDFGNVLLGSKTPAQSFIVFNPGGAPVEIGTPTTTAADFVVTSSTCGTSVSPASRCTVGVAFQPQARGFRTGDLVIPGAAMYGDMPNNEMPYNLSPVAASAILSGDGVVQAQLSAPATIDLGPYILGDPALSRTVAIGNAGNGVLTFSSIGASGPFTMSHDCPLNLNPGESCSVVLGFSAGVAGTASGALTIATNAAGGTRSIPVTALAQAQAVPVLQVTPTLLGFGSRMVGTMSPSQRVTITNIGGADATLASLAIHVEYLVSSTCGLTLAPGSSCFADVTFKPLGFGPRPGTLTIPANDAGSPHGVSLGGTGCRPFMIGRPGANRCAP